MAKSTRKRHFDGSICLEGTRSVPPRYRPCCEIFGGHTTTCAWDIRYEWWRKSQQWVIVIPEGLGGGGITMRFCPHCGTELPGQAARNSRLPGKRAADRRMRSSTAGRRNQ